MHVPIDIPAGIRSDDTTYSESPAWSDGSNVRFRLGRPQTIGGWESLTLSTLTGVCRKVFPWTDNSNVLNVGFGTHSNLQVWVGGALSDITPVSSAAVTLGANPIATTNTSATVVVTETAHQRLVGDIVTISGASAVATVTINGTWTLTAVTANTWSFTAGSSANATTTGGGSAVVVTPSKGFTVGAIDGAGSAGYGTGAYGTGGYGTASGADYFALTWDLAAWGQKLLACPRHQPIFEWSNASTTRAQAINNAPQSSTAMLVSPQFQVFAIGCTQENGTYNPKCVRHSATRDETTWATDATSASTAREYVLPGGGWLVTGRVCGKNLLIWSNHELWLGTYVGQVGQVWRFDKVGDKCGVIGPNAAVVVGSSAFWMSPDHQFFTYTLGGFVTPVDCPIRKDMTDHIAASQIDKIAASSNVAFGEVRWEYPDSRDGLECSRYVALSVAGDDIGKWYRGQMARTFMVDSGPAPYPIGVTYGGNVYWHEKGQSADGGVLDWFIESADFYVSEDVVGLVRGMWPDIDSDQIGAVTMTPKTRFYPQGDVISWGPYAITASQDRVDFKAKGRLMQVRYAGSSAPAYARLGRPVFDVVQGGRK